MRFREISEKIEHAMPLWAKHDAMGNPDKKKAIPSIPSAAPPVDPTTAIAQGLAQGIAPVVQGAIGTAIQADDAEEANLQAQRQAQAQAELIAQKDLENSNEIEAVKRLAQPKQ